MNNDPSVSIPGQLTITGEGFPEVEVERSDPSQQRSFASIPGLISNNMEVPKFHHLDGMALRRVDPKAIEANLYGIEGGTSVNGLLLNDTEYGLIVRSDGAFRRAVEAKTMTANQNTPTNEQYRRQARSAQSSFENKLDKYEGVLKGYAGERKRLETLLSLQSWRPDRAIIDEADARILGTDAWMGSFVNVISTIAKQRHLNATEIAHTKDALAYKLFRGPQSDKIGYWGAMLQLSLRYNKAKTSIFNQSQRRLHKQTGALAVRLNNLNPDQ